MKQEKTSTKSAARKLSFLHPLW